MQSIKVQRYAVTSHGWAGTIEPEDKAWIAFIACDGSPTFFLNRDPVTGAVEPNGQGPEAPALP